MGRWGRWLLPIALLGIGAFAYRAFSRSPADVKTYQVVDVVRTDVAATVVATGTLQPWTVVDIKSKAGGKVEELPVEVGDAVRQGQVLARIDPSDSQLAFNQAQADLDSARAKGKQSVENLSLTQTQTSGSIREAAARRRVAAANLSASQARLLAAQDALQAEETLARGAIRQAELAFESSLEDSKLLVYEQANRRATVEANLRKATESERFAKADHERLVALEKKGFVAGREVEQARNALESAEAQLAVAREDADQLAQTQKAEQRSSAAAVALAESRLEDARAQAVSVRDRRNSLQVARTEVESARQQMRQADAALETARAGVRSNEIRRLEIAASESSIFRAQSSLANAKKTLEDTVLRAPTSGIVLQKYVEQGTLITSGQAFNSAGTSILQIGDVSRMYVSVQVDETDVARVRIGQRARISIDAFGEDRFRGQVIRIEPLAKVEQNITTVSVRVEVDPCAPQFRNLKPNMNATCTF